MIVRRTYNPVSRASVGKSKAMSKSLCGCRICRPRFLNSISDGRIGQIFQRTDGISKRRDRANSDMMGGDVASYSG